MSPASAFDTGAAAVERLGCAEADDEAACLRALPVEDLVAVASLTDLMSFSEDALFLSPVIDGSLLAEPPQNRLSRGEADVPLIAGSNAVEGLLFAGFDLILTRADLRDKIAEYVGDDDLAADIVALYPIVQFPIHRDAYIAFLGDVTFVCPGLAVVEDAAAGEPSFAYHFTRSPLLARPIGAVHSMELVYLFETFGALYLIPSATDTRMADTMQRAWGGFARAGAPPLASGWPAFDPADPAIALLDDPASVTDELVDGRCEALAALGLSF